MRLTKQAVLYTISLLLVGIFLLLTVDGSTVYSDRRRAQNAADTAALAAALAKVRGGDDYQNKALERAANNSYNNDGITNTVQIYTPPISGPYSGAEDYIQVVITSQTETSIFGISQENRVVAVAYAPPPCSECYFPHIALMNGDGPVVSGAPDPQSGIKEDLANIDELLKQSIRASLAYNKPETMNLDETVTIELLLNPSVSPKQLSEQLTESGTVATGVVEITPRMRAFLYSHDNSALIVQPLQDNPEQLVGETSTAKWGWSVKAVEGGTHTLTLKILRLVKFGDEDYWREVDAYKSDIQVNVSFGQALKSLDWKWVLPTLAAALIIPGFWRWFDERKKNNINLTEDKKLGKQNKPSRLKKSSTRKK